MEQKVLNKFKVFLIGILSAMLIIGTVLFQTPVTASAATSDVSLYYVDSNYVYHGGTSNEIYIKVSNKSYQKDVSVHYLYDSSNGTWGDQKAQFVKSLDSNYDVFAANISGFGNLKYSLSCTENGNTYCDDNNGKMYTLSNLLGTAPICAERSEGSALSNYNINALVNNYGYNKNVKVVYTIDNWATTREQQLSYIGTKDDGTEYWTTDINISDLKDTNNFKYKLVYTVNGTTYYDDNWGNYYNSSYCNEY